MKPLEAIEFQTKKQLYDFMAVRLKAYLEEAPDWCAALGNASALFNALLKDLNWAGFYLMKQEMLVLGPFQGKPACVQIELGKGVCGTAALKKDTQLVADVHAFEGHIACDSASNSELVVPILYENETVGVIDLDSPLYERFDEEDARGFERIAQILSEKIDWQAVLNR
ncbi:GAF domain-containing protein [Acidaminobacter hydrogenoformans]|uniref:GAF domain-containing protein n=1 Tax=Acidaminobacter hydrogenoformans DSM 2784 TaxID=1120920 RepID=A0A1G5RUX1_9FIRM|nr:GAF domain-containing protein [Acidaminobacter hydrogenoformans]SCZ77707.1 GAF domain-containing protein [Acidaminobacter hydrogenoformans DSM 2784]